jgi:Putative amidoligase enzyme
MAAAAVERPPEPLNHEGRPRRVGIEIEFGAIGVADAAALVQQLYGGAIREVSRHRLEVAATRFGDFRIEIDSHYVHRAPSNGGTLVDRMKAVLADVTGDIAGRWLPVEIAAPPVEIDDLAAIDRLVSGLRARHAAGTGSRRIYTFDLQLNPDVPSIEPDSLRRHLQAYLVLSRWLRASIAVDATRRLLPFVRPFPEAYVRKVLAADYRPDLHGLAADYLAANPSRFRELDLLPLFAYLVPEQYYATPADRLVKPRPAFHYRLPDSRVDDPSWGGVIEEWNRWLQVERLAADPGRLAAACRTQLEAPRAGGWLERLRDALIP